MSRFLRLLAAALCGVVILGLCVATADARPLPQVRGVAKAGQSVHKNKVKIRWHRVRGAHYQMRVAPAANRLRAARVIRTARARAFTPRLINRKVYYVQVRAIRGGAAGAWSRMTRVRLLKRGGPVVHHPAPAGRTLLRATFDN